MIDETLAVDRRGDREGASAPRNPYAPPRSVVVDAQIEHYDAQPTYFPVGVAKLVTLYVFTCGFYALFWFWKNWDLVRSREQAEISAFWRAFFSVFWIYPLFQRMRDSGRAHGVTRAFPAGLLALIYIGSRFAWRLPGFYALIGLSGLVIMAIAQSYATKVNDAATPGYAPNVRLTGLNWAWIATVVAGAVLVIGYGAATRMSR